MLNTLVFGGIGLFFGYLDLTTHHRVCFFSCGGNHWGLNVAFFAIFAAFLTWAESRLVRILMGGIALLSALLFGLLLLFLSTVKG